MSGSGNDDFVHHDSSVFERPIRGVDIAGAQRVRVATSWARSLDFVAQGSNSTLVEKLFSAVEGQSVVSINESIQATASIPSFVVTYGLARATPLANPSNSSGGEGLNVANHWPRNGNITLIFFGCEQFG